MFVVSLNYLKSIEEVDKHLATHNVALQGTAYLALMMSANWRTNFKNVI